MKGLAKEQIGINQRHRQQGGDGQREGQWRLGGDGQRGKVGTSVIVSTIKTK